MPIRPPALDDRRYQDLLEEMLARIPAHTPEWTNPRPGDPGVTILELFAWLADALLYRVNLIPERQRLVFLSLLGIPVRPAAAATGLISLSVDGDDKPSLSLQRFATISEPVPFETLTELNVVPVEGEFYAKRKLSTEEQTELQPVIDGLRDVYGIDADTHPDAYITTPAFPGNAAVAGGFDVVQATVDQSIWLALFAPEQKKVATKQLVAAANDALAKGTQGRAPLISIGVVPSILLAKPLPDTEDDLAVRDAIPFACEVVRERNGVVEAVPLDILDDTSAGLTRRGVFRIALPAPELRKLPVNDVQDDVFAGVADRPPRLDEPAKAARLVAWVRLRPTIPLQSLLVSWAGINCVEIDQRRRLGSTLLGNSSGDPDQVFAVPARFIDPASIAVEVEGPRGFEPWENVSDLLLANRDSQVYKLDSEAATITFGDGVRGRIPGTGVAVRFRFGRAGGGAAGNLPPGAIKKINVPKLKVVQPVATTGGEEAETVFEAERRIPGLFRHQNRAVTADDYRVLAALTPGVQVGRVEVLPLFLPLQRRSAVPGVVSVMVLPQQSRLEPPNPRPDRLFIEAVDRQLKVRRPLGTELYTIGCEYVPVGLSVGITVRDGFGRDTVAQAVKDMVRLFLWPLAPGGPTGEGWPLGRRLREREVEAVVARVPGVDTVTGSNIFVKHNDDWMLLPQPVSGAAEFALEQWQLPELLGLVVGTDGEIPASLDGLPNPFGKTRTIAVPVIPEVC